MTKPKVEIEIKHVPTQYIPQLPALPHRLYCYLCHGTIVASEGRIPDIVIEKLRGVPCSKCVSPEDWIKKQKS